MLNFGYELKQLIPECRFYDFLNAVIKGFLFRYSYKLILR